MLILQVSDIHFKAPQCASEDDPTRPYRTRMLQDLRARCVDLGNVDAILIGGDIAYRADPSEYQSANAWIAELVGACGCPLERVFVVPGNHDVDRGIIKRERSIQNAQRTISLVPLNQRSDELIAQLRDTAVGHTMFAPLAAYNDFAKNFDCQLYPKKLFWKQDLPLRDDVALRIYGLNSTLLSGAVNGEGGQDDTRDSLFMSHWQTVFDPVEDVVNAVLSHHPPDWFADHEGVEEAVRGRTTLQFFGHRHRQGNIRDRQYMRFEAGAMNPDRNELAWHPSYNLVRLSVVGEGADRQLRIQAHFMTWQSAAPERYVRVVDSNASDVWEHTIAIPGRPRIQAPITTSAVTAPAAATTTPPSAYEGIAMTEKSTRRLVTRWWRLPMNARREIALDLKLIDESEVALPEPERYGLALARAGERKKIEELTQEVEKWENQ
ncbi:MAG: metallophosphoesterase [Burkholderiales bacterium]